MTIPLKNNDWVISVTDDILSQDPEARVACETITTTGLVLVSGEVTSSCYSDFQKIIRFSIQRFTRKSSRKIMTT